MIWEKGGKKGEDSRRREPPLFLSRISTIGRRTLSLSRCRFWCSHKRNPPPGAVVLWTSLLSSSSTLSAKTTKAARRTQSFSKKKRKELEADFSPCCVSLKEIGNGTLSQNRHCDALVDERELQTSSSRVMAQRCVDLSLSLSLCVCVSLFFVCSRQIPFGRARRSGHSFLIFEIGKKKESDENPKNAPIDWLGKNLHMRIARTVASRSFCPVHTNTKRRLTT